MFTYRPQSFRLRHVAVTIVLAIYSGFPINISVPAQQTVTDPDPVGYWESVDFVWKIEDFQTGKKQFEGELFIKEFQFNQDGTASMNNRWEQDQLIHPNGKTHAQYLIRDINNATYLFLPWLSGDVTDRGMEPAYYVFKKSAMIIHEYDDICWRDVSGVDFSEQINLPATLIFNEKTIWPDYKKMPAGCNPKELLTMAMNPGLGIRELHNEGITGKGVNVAMIDQPLMPDHPEFKGKIADYYDAGCEGGITSMHGPAVASLLVGTHCGTAPGAKIYYAAAPSWKGDTAYYAKALEWIIEQNEKLPESEKIRVVSVSASPSGPGSPFEKNFEMWDDACARAAEQDILVLDCTSHRGFIGQCYYDPDNLNNVAACTAGFPGMSDKPIPERILVPCSRRTVAEEYENGDFSYRYWGQGGLSWSIPYCAGVLALGWQVQPGLDSRTMKELLLKSAYTNEAGYKFIYPKEFIKLVKTVHL